MNIEQVRRILIVGSGTMGQQIGLQCAMHGYEVVLYDIAPKALESAILQIKTYTDRILAEGGLTASQAEETLKRITTNSDAALAAQEVDLISESVPEDPKLKGKVLAQFHALCPARTIFTTNTSTLLPSQFAKLTGRPEQFAAFHFHLPVWSSNVVDIMPHPGTKPEVVALLNAFARQIGQIPINIEKEHYGYVFNAMYSAINREALTMAANGVASVEDIDRAWMGIMKMPIGPFGMMDQVGIDTIWHITNYWAKRLIFDRQLRKNADFLWKEYVSKGKLGIKSMKGFFEYPDAAYVKPDFLSGKKSEG